MGGTTALGSRKGNVRRNLLLMPSPKFALIMTYPGSFDVRTTVQPLHFSFEQLTRGDGKQSKINGNDLFPNLRYTVGKVVCNGYELPSRAKSNAESDVPKLWAP